MDIVSSRQHHHCDVGADAHGQLDYPDENIVDELKHTNAFIDEGVKAGGNVLIHW